MAIPSKARPVFTGVLTGALTVLSSALGSAAENSRSSTSSSTDGQAGSSPAPEASPPSIIAPVALSDLEVPYPLGQQNEAAVIVQLLISAEGIVTEAKSISGVEPFASAAAATALQWRFSPARRAGKTMAARIRVQILFTPPEFEILEPAPTTSEASSSDLIVALPLEVQPQSPEVPAPIEVVVQGQRVVGVKKLGRGEVRQMPGAFGDPYRAVEALPGVTPIASGLPYFFVRGSPPGNVGYFFNQIQVPLLYHVAAGPGVIHPAFIRSVALYSGAYPANYGRFAGGIVAGEAEDPHWESRGELNLRLVDAGAFLEIPFDEGKGSAMLAGRYSYTDGIVSLLAPEVSLGYWDYPARIQYDLTPEDSITLFGFGSHDFLATDDEAGKSQQVLDLTFHRLSASYRREIGSTSSLTLTGMYGLDRTGIGAEPQDPSDDDPGDLRTRTVAGRLTFLTELNDSIEINAGLSAQTSRVKIDFNFENPLNNVEGSQYTSIEDASFPEPGFPELVLEPLQAFREERQDATINSRFGSRRERVAGGWLAATIRAGSGVTISPGIRLDAYEAKGTVAYAPEPRISVRYDLSPDLSITHAIGLAFQPPSFAIPLPGFEGASDEGLQKAVQSSAGIEGSLPAGLTASATVFQNVTFNSTDVFGASNLQDADVNVSAFTSRTTNHTYGLELYLRRSLTARLGGFISYTLARSLRSVARLKGPSRFDRRHVLNVALAFDLGAHWRLGGRAVAYSGTPAEVAYPEAALNPPRTDWYYRLDWRLEKRWLIGDNGAWVALVFEVLNTTLNKETLRSSCYAYGCQDEPLGPVTLPSVGLEASF